MMSTKPRHLWPLLPLCAALLAGCGGGSSTSQKAVTVGDWGSDSPLVAMRVTATGAAYGAPADNLVGTIPKPLTVSGSGHFDAMGTVGEAEGPPPPDGASGGYTYPARYTGTIDGTTMTLTVTVSPIGGTPYTDGPFTLTYGKTNAALPG